MEISPWLFSQIDAGKLGAKTDYKAWYQSQYQTASTMSRDNIANAIAGAEEMLARELEFWAAPKQILSEEHPYPRTFDPEWRNVWAQESFLLKDVKLTYGKVIDVGIETFTEIDPAVPITFTDVDGDGKMDTFTSDPIPSGITDPASIYAFFSPADRIDTVSDDELTWEVRPVRVVISGGNIVISGPIWLVVKPNLQYRPVPVPADPTDVVVSYVSTLKASYRTVDETLQGALIYERPVDWCAPITDYPTDPCSQAERSVCYAPRNKAQGIVIPTVTDYTPVDYGFGLLAPTRINVNYVSGVAWQTGFGSRRMDNLFAQMVSRLACTLLADRSGVTNSESQIDYWRGYPSTGKGDRETLMVSPQTANNPFGLRRGAVWAWGLVMELNERHLAGAIR
jgi:hypothetical protein